jgi:hypothetical protein
MKIIRAVILAALLPSGAVEGLPIGIINTHLQPSTVAGFNRYVQAAEARIDKQLSSSTRFLYIENLPASQQASVMASLRSGQTFMQQLETPDASGHVITTPDGLIHHWVGDIYIPGATMQEVLSVVQDYNDAAKIYYPQIVRSRLLSRNDNHFKVAMRFREKEIITVTLDTEHDVQFTELDPTHWSSRSISTRIAEVADRDEHEKPVGYDGGFLWRINSYWRFVQQNGGVYVECEAVSLTRDIPTGLGWLVGGFITSIPKDSLSQTLAATRKAVRARKSHSASSTP